MARLKGSTNLDPEVDYIIHTRVQQLRKLGISMDRETFAMYLEEDIRNKGYRPPSIENIKRKISADQYPQDHPFIEPWSLGSTAKYPIPSEALPTVVAVYKKRLAENDVLTIREALWIGRLYGVIEPKDLVYDWAFLYATFEMVSEDKGEPFFDSKNLDMELIEDVYSARETQREIAIWGIAETYGADPVKLKDLNLSIEEIEEIAKSGEYQKEAQNER